MSETAPGGTPGLPAELLEWVRRYAGTSLEDDPEKLFAGVRRALQHTLAHPGPDREAAYSLLAADGLLTLAVERLADAEDPEDRLRALVAALAVDAALPSTSAGDPRNGRSG
jgi:hypothetical protein